MASAAVAPPTPAATASVGAPSVSASTSASAQSAPAAPVAATTAAVCNSSLDEQIERLRRCEYLREGEVKALCLRAREILVDESNVQRVDAPVTVSEQCGMVQHMYAVVHCCFHVVSRPTVVGRDLHAKTHPYYQCRVVSSSLLFSLDMRRHSRAVLRPRRAVQDRGRVSRQELPLPRRLRRSGLLLRRDLPPPPGPQGPLPRPHHVDPRQPREPADHPGLRLLRRVPAQVRQRQCLEGELLSDVLVSLSCICATRSSPACLTLVFPIASCNVDGANDESIGSEK